MVRIVAILLLLFLMQCSDKKQPGRQPDESATVAGVSDEGLKYVTESLMVSLARSVIRVSFMRTSTSDYCKVSCVVVTKTIGGAFAEYFKCGYMRVIKLDMKDWTSFIDAVYACRIYEWTRQNTWINEDSSFNKDAFMESFPLDYAPSVLEISFSDRSDFEFEYWGIEDPKGWVEFKGIMSDMESRIKSGQKK